MRSVLQVEPLKALFIMLLEAVETGFLQESKHSLLIQEDDDCVFVMITSHHRSIKEDMTRAFAKLNVPFYDLASTFVIIYDTPCLGYIYRNNDPVDRETFCQTIHDAIEMKDQSTLVTLKG